ncbi:unnamed protein product [Bemisia tabaci]|uniref:Uncharacterized protein n=1 Tax=Bemisia tabaci TaxID=7038 RepID=A0A9P0A9L3_BEMTA|nr:unnamed protein product [Bemisia tabaci]
MEQVILDQMYAFVQKQVVADMDVRKLKERRKTLSALADTIRAKLPDNHPLKQECTRRLSEHEDRVQKATQQLNVPEWFLNRNRSFSVSLKHQNEPQSCLNNKMSTTGRRRGLQKVAPKARWSTNGLLDALEVQRYKEFPEIFETKHPDSSCNSSTTSPRSVRSSFSYKQPYLGWRSQEMLDKPRTPAERLAAGLLHKKDVGSDRSISILSDSTFSV